MSEPREATTAGRPRIPVFLLTRARMTPVCWAARARRRPVRAVLILGAAAAVALLLLAVFGPRGSGCTVKAVTGPGQRAHLACVPR